LLWQILEKITSLHAVNGFRGFSPAEGKGEGMAEKAVDLLFLHLEKEQKQRREIFLLFLLFCICIPSLRDGATQALRAGLLPSDNPLWKHPHRLTRTMLN
jgi:hypothetical protein